MKTCYLSICDRYGPAPLLSAVFFVSFFGTLGGLYYLIAGSCSGIAGASIGESAFTHYLRGKHFNLRDGSAAMCVIQIGCVITGFLLGLAVQYYSLPAPSIRSMF